MVLVHAANSCGAVHEVIHVLMASFIFIIYNVTGIDHLAYGWYHLHWWIDILPGILSRLLDQPSADNSCLSLYHPILQMPWACAVR